MENNFDSKKIPRNKVFLVIISLIFSLLLWVYVTSTVGDEHTEVYNGVKLVYVGEDALRASKGLVITSRDATSVRVSITGSRRVISKLDVSDLSATIDLSSITSANTYVSAYKINFPSGIDASSLQVNYTTPETVSYRVDKLSTKTVPVKGIFNGSAAEGFSAESLEFEPSSVKVSGPASSLEKIEDAWIEVDRENVDKTLIYDSDYVLRDADGAAITDDAVIRENPTVSVTLPIISVKEVALDVNIIDGAGATDANVKIDIEPDSVVLAGSAEVLSGTNVIYLANIDLSDIDDSMTATYPIVIPNDTDMISGAKEAKVTVELKGLSKKTVSVSNISSVEVTDGYNADVMVESIDVIIRGPEDVLEGISDVNVRAVADLSEFGNATGIVSAPVKIYIDGTTNAGALGDYKVYVNISIQGPEENKE